MNRSELTDEITFFDAASRRLMKYILPTSKKPFAGWICFKNKGDGGWVTLRKATEEDVVSIDSAPKSHLLLLDRTWLLVDNDGNEI